MAQERLKPRRWRSFVSTYVEQNIYFGVVACLRLYSLAPSLHQPRIASSPQTRIVTGATDTTWSSNLNWIGNHPAAGDNAVFDGTFTNQPNLTGATGIGGIWMKSNIGQNVTISGSTLTLGGNTINGTADLGILVNKCKYIQPYDQC
jgi:hypothetical protein